MKITMIQKFESYSDTEWENNCQYFKVNGVAFPTCVMINDGEYIQSLKARKDSAHDEVNTLLGDYTEQGFIHEFGVTKEEYNTFKGI